MACYFKVFVLIICLKGNLFSFFRRQFPALASQEVLFREGCDSPVVAREVSVAV